MRGCLGSVRSALPGLILLAALVAAWFAVKYGARVPDQQMPAPLQVAAGRLELRGLSCSRLRRARWAGH